MRVLIQALPRDGLATRVRAGRYWPSDKAVAVEVVDEDESPTIEVVKRNAHTGLEEKGRAPDPERISKKDYEAIKADPVLRILADGETGADLSDAAVGAARKQASDLAGRLTDAEAKNATLTEQLAKAKKRIAELEGQHGTAADESAMAAQIEAEADDRSKHSNIPRSKR
jgi:hypothetical protein